LRSLHYFAPRMLRSPPGYRDAAPALNNLSSRTRFSSDDQGDGARALITLCILRDMQHEYPESDRVPEMLQPHSISWPGLVESFRLFSSNGIFDFSVFAVMMSAVKGRYQHEISDCSMRLISERHCRAQWLVILGTPHATLLISALSPRTEQHNADSQVAAKLAAGKGAISRLLRFSSMAVATTTEGYDGHMRFPDSRCRSRMSHHHRESAT